MPKLKPFFVRTLILFLVPCSFYTLCGCFDNVSDNQWQATVPGLYEGTNSAFKEVLEIGSNKMYHYSLFLKERLIKSQTGSWIYDVTSGMIELQPFTSFYDRKSNTFTTNGFSWVAII